MKRNPAKLARQFVEFEELFSRKLTLVMSWQEAIFGHERTLSKSNRNIVAAFIGVYL